MIDDEEVEVGKYEISGGDVGMKDEEGYKQDVEVVGVVE